jgi:DNA-binding beta-propeller fold protein YncE
VGTNVKLNLPFGVAISPDGSYALVTDTNNHLIRRVVLSTASSSGSTNGVGTLAKFNSPYGVAISSDGSYALVADYNNHLIRRIVLSTASVTTVAGSSSLQMEWDPMLNFFYLGL